MDKKRNHMFWFFLTALTVILATALFYRGRGPKQVAHPNWSTDFEAAKRMAAEQGKDILINFAGSDWCYWCKRLEKEVLTDAEFVIPAQQDFVFVLVDFPTDRSGQSEQVQDQNQRLAMEYRIEGYPTIILTDKDGNPYARTGYQLGGGDSYLKHVKELRTKKDQTAIVK